MNRVVITGMGVVSALGNDVETFWNNIVSGKDGIDLITSFDTEQFNSKYAAEVKNIDYGGIPKRFSLIKTIWVYIFQIVWVE